MKILLTRTPGYVSACLWAVLCALGLTLAGCGGGGASANNNDTSGGGNGRTATTASTGPASLNGVVAVGTPVLSATVTAYDALGVAQGTTTSSASDGSFTLNLTSTTRNLPLFVQAIGADMLGTPVVVHTVVQTLNTGGTVLHPTRNAVNITPLTDAIVGMLLGGDPADYFATPTAYSRWTQLSDATALTVATTFLKTVIAANLRDGGFSNAANANFFSDPAFVANKTGMDVVLESVRMQYGVATNAHPTLLLTNRLALVGNTEVTVDLNLASGFLAGATSKVDTPAILSTAKVTTGSTSVMPSLVGLNTLKATLNVAMARNYNEVEMGFEPIFDAAYAYYDGQSKNETLTDLVNYGLTRHQFSDFQIVGCLDEVIAPSGCVRIGVAALIHDRDENVVGIYRNAVSYTAQNGWRLRGNDRQTPWSVRPAAWQTWDASGAPYTTAPATGEAANSGIGIQTVIIAREFMRATIQMPNNTAVVFIHCDIVNFTPMCLERDQSGDLLRDQVIRNGVSTVDLTVGARYRILTETVGNGTEDNTLRISAGRPTVTSNAIFPLPDGIATTPLDTGSFLAGMTVSWADWAAANPKLRVVEVRGVIRSTTTAPIKHIVAVRPMSGTQVTLPAFDTVPPDAQSYVLWLTAEDALGRRYISRIVVQAP